MSSTDPIVLNIINVADIVEVLDRYGICIIKQYVKDEQLINLNAEFDLVFNSAKSESAIYSVDKHPTNEDGLVARCKPDMLSNKFNSVKNVFLSDFMGNVSSRYFKTKCIVNDDVFFTHEKASKTPILPWHFDRQQALKFYINLIDVDGSNGAFEFDIGSHREGHFRANYYILAGIKVGDIPNNVPINELHNPIVVAVEAGDLVIFDADGFHRGGVVNEGKERKIVRGHTHPIPDRGYSPRLFDAHWWLHSPFNIAGSLSSKSSRVLPVERLTRSKLTR